MAKPPGKCIFCNGSGNMSKEHIWADWLEPYVPRTMQDHTASVEVYYPTHVEKEVKRRPGDIHSRKLRVVCKPCNEGWMSDLQQSAKPILLPLIFGNPAKLYRRSQAILASWSGMAAMVAEFGKRDRVAIAATDRAFLQSAGRLPSNWRVWIGKYDRVEWAGHYSHGLAHVADETIPEITIDPVTRPNTQTTVFVVGKLLFFALSSQVPRVTSLLQFTSRKRGMTHRIWPPNRTIDWPPAVTMTDRNADDLAEYLMRIAKAASHN